jgi:hypothetical protein
MYYYTLKTTSTYRVPTVQDALKLRKYLEKTGPGELNSFTYTTKEIKLKGEVIETYQLVKASFNIDSEKEPEGVLPVIIEEDTDGAF